jgi:extracellular factor (EF) 3-hydroxypalmitic acid methyl ester biosynthesis protein
MSNIAISPVSNLSASIKSVIDRGGPEPAEYDFIRSWLDDAERLLESGSATRQQLQQVWRDQGECFLRETMQGFGLLKPHGYAGDFEMIDRIYTQWRSPNPHFVRWDDYFHAQSAPQAVRNRKEEFQKAVSQSVTVNQDSPIRVLNLGSGPCRDVSEFISTHPGADVTFDCVDQDPKAIAYATSLLDKTRGKARVHFRQDNVVRFKPVERYDLVWSGGLFDYLPDRLFVALLSRMVTWTRPGGRIVVGNFSRHNPSRRYMELVGEWILCHRDETALRALANKAHLPADRVEVFGEAEGVNLFLDIRP